MFRPSLLLIVFLILVSNACAIQLGDSREQIIAQYGKPTGGDLNRGVGTYRWIGWRLDIEIGQGIVERLVFTKDTTPISDSEVRQLLNDNGGFAAWQATDHIALEPLADKKWRRTIDGAEAFTLAGDKRGICLASKAWVDSWLQEHSVAPRVVVTASAIDQSAPTAFGGLVVLAFIGLIVWLVAQFRKKHAAPSTPGNGGLWTPPTDPKHLESVCDVTAPPPASLPNLDVRKSKTLADLSWQEFELLIGELYRRQGYSVELCSGDGSDGGVDLWLRKEGTTVLVQCKHWKVYKVGVSPVRELFGILMAEKADHAIFVTTGKFTQDARSFAAGKAMELIDGLQLNAIVEEARGNGQGDLLDVNSWSRDFAQAAMITAPVCPFCRSTMVLRRGKQRGNQFWGCSTYPRCRGKRNVRSELMSV